MYVSTSFPTLLAIFAASASAIPITISRQAAQTTLTLQQQLELAGTAVDRLALIPNDQDFVFDFNASTTGITAGQGTVHSIFFRPSSEAFKKSSILTHVIRR